MSKFQRMDKLFGVSYPKGFLVVAIDRAEDAEQAAGTLRNEGFEDVRLLTGKEVLSHHQVFLAHENTLQKIGAELPTQEAIRLENYLEAAQNEYQYFITIHAPNRTEAERALPILRAHHAHLITYYGDWTMIQYD
jgi:hypothetical protein